MELSGVIWDAAKCLCACANEQTAYIIDLEDNLNSLNRKWKDLRGQREDLRRKVDEAENTREMQRTQIVIGWMEDVDALQKAIEDIQVQRDQEVQKSCLIKYCPKNCRSSCKLGKNVAKMLKNADELMTKGEKFLNKNIEITHNLPLIRPVEMPLDETIGLERMVDIVWKSIEEKDVGVIGLYGMGGVGKTTLLKRINNELGKNSSSFDVVMWVVVSKDYNLDSIMDNIRKLIGVGDKIWNLYRNREEKAAIIYQVLKEKKFVLLLDDIWERLDLSTVGVPHPKNTNFQSKVLFTTRLQDVCTKMQSQRKFKVEILIEKEALELFYMKIGEETLRSHPNIPKIAKEMAIECKGLPLALIVVGSAMAGVKSMEAWEHSRNYLTSSSWTASELEKVFFILKLSYDRLPDEIHKKCFLYCALYPEDYEIQVLNLIDKWIAEGFLGNNVTKSLQDMRDHGESVIEKLKGSCLLESDNVDLFLSRTVKLHDVIRDMALWLARDQDENKKRIFVEGDTLALSQNDVETWRIVERISILQNGQLHFPIVACPNLITLRLKLERASLASIKFMSELKVLDLLFDKNRHIKLPPEIGDLVLLEYLSLSGPMRASELPTELKNLKNLKFFILDISGNNLPLEVISNLKQLRQLRLSIYVGEEKKFLEMLESILNLEALWIKIRTENGLKKLLKSTKLQSCIYGLTLEHVTPTNMPSLLASMSRMMHLNEIYFVRSSSMKDFFIFDTCYLSVLRKVSISECHGIVDLTWLKYAPLLQDLKVFFCTALEEVIKGGTEYRENEDNIFSSLIKLELLNLPKLKSIHKKALPFPSLKFVEVSFCPNLKNLPFDSNATMEKLREIRGAEQWWNELEWEDPNMKHKLHSVFRS